MAELIPPTERLYHAWSGAHAEWGPGLHEDGFGLLATDMVDSRSGFTAWLERLNGESSRCMYRWIVDDGSVLGGIALRHGYDDDAVQLLGHIGYGVRPSAWNRGLASWALDEMVSEAGLLGLRQLLVICDVGNAASIRAVERQGGILEDSKGTACSPVHRYWISTD